MQYFSSLDGTCTDLTKSAPGHVIFLHPVGSAGHVAHSGVSGAQNVDTLLFNARVGPVWIRQKVCRGACGLASDGICGVT
jgi:hypothetical protein